MAFFDRFFRKKDPFNEELRRLEQEERQLTQKLQSLQEESTRPRDKEDVQVGARFVEPTSRTSRVPNAAQLKLQARIARNRFILACVIIGVLVILIVKALS